MFKKMFRNLVIAGATAAASVALAEDSSGFRIIVPMPPPTSRPSETDISSVSDAQQDVATAQRDAQAARAAYINAQSRLTQVTANLQIQLQNGSTLGDATNAVTAAKASFDAAAQPILESLAQNPDYRRAVDAVAQSQQNAAAVCASPNSGTDDRFAAAKAVLDVKASLTKLQDAALQTSSEVAAAKEKYLQANQQLKEVRAQLWQAIRQDPSYVAASQAVDDARDKSASADQQLAIARQNLYAAEKRVSDKVEAWQKISDWSYQHGLPEPP